MVTTRNRADQLAELLAALKNQTVPADLFEVVVVDDASTDSTNEVLGSEAAAENLRLVTIERAASGGAAVGREVGWRQATSARIAFTDDDCVPDPNWLETMLSAAEANPGAIIQGRTSPRPDQLDRRGPYSRTMDVQVLSPHFPTTNILYPRALLEAVGGFDVETYRNAVGGEDTDLGWRGIAAGAEAVFVADSHVFHAVNVLGPAGKLKVAARQSAALPFAHHHGSRAEFTHGVFRKHSHLRLLLAIAGLALRGQLRGVPLLLAAPYARELRARGKIEGGGLAAAPFYALHDCVEVYATVRGGVRGGKFIV